ncbi:MAG TPA: hypothetical protein PKI93_00625 [Alphaproteobacteria bacterium]|nr:hypothetical protein [Alphaproteobacteria bacterium]HNS44594.1 hypothetical protein [Alphaproteobacteria bacterium]
MNRLAKTQQKPASLGLVRSNSAAITAPNLPKSNVPFIRKRPSLGGGPQLVPVAAKKKQEMKLPLPKLAPPLSQSLGYHNLRIVDIANNFAERTSPYNIGKVYAAANALHVRYTPVSNAGNASLFASNAAMISGWAPKKTSTPKSSPKPSNVMPFRPVGGPVLTRSPLAGTGLMTRVPKAPALRLAA